MEKSDGTTLETLFNTALLFNTMSSRMNFTGAIMFSYFDKCLLDNALDKWCLVTPHEDDQTVENFKYSLEEWFMALLLDDAFLAQKEWMANVMKKPYTMKVKDFGNRLKMLNCFLTLMPHNDGKDTVFTDTDLKALLLKSMPLTWQNSYLLIGTCTSDNFRKMLSYFIQLQSITDTQAISRSGIIPQINDNRNQHKYICTNCGRSGQFSSSFQNRQNNIDRIPRKQKPNNQGPFVNFKGPCPVHPMASHAWGD